jgi:4-amino-4-deoxy-L-arabinose transferase-like glycosyltransferase
MAGIANIVSIRLCLHTDVVPSSSAFLYNQTSTFYTLAQVLAAIPSRPRSTLLGILVLWAAFYASFTLFTPPLLDDADSVHAEVAREMLLRHDYITLYANGIRYLEKAPLLYWSMAAAMRAFQVCGAASPQALAVAARIPLSLAILALALILEALARRIFRSARSGLYAGLILLSSFGIFIFTRILIPDAIVCLFTALALYAFWRTEEIDAMPRRRTRRPSPAPEVKPQPTLPRPPSAPPRLHVVSSEPHGDAVRPASLRPPPLPAFKSTVRAERIHIISSRAQRIHVISKRARQAAAKEAKSRLQPDVDGTATGTAAPSSRSGRGHLRLYCGLFAVACALNVLTKGLIGVVFPVAIVVVYLLLTRGIKRTLRRLRALHPWATLEAFLFVAAPWHILAGFANPTEGHPARFHFVNGHWIVPLPTLGNVHGWFWFYFMNEHLLRYLNLRVPHDYDTSPLWLFWGLCLVWIMPWSAFVFKATGWAAPIFGRSRSSTIFRSQLRRHDLPLKRRGALLLLVWAAVVLLFFAFSTRQEYYVLPALPALAILIAGWLARDSVSPFLRHVPDAISVRPSESEIVPPYPPQASGDPESQASPRPSSKPSSFRSAKLVHLSPRFDQPRSTVRAPEPASSNASMSAAAGTRPGKAYLLQGGVPSALVPIPQRQRRWSAWSAVATRITAALLLLGMLFAAAAIFILVHTQTPAPGTDLATLLTQHPSDYALSMGHFLDLDTRALGLFRIPLALAALSLFGGPFAALLLRRRRQPHAANLALAAGAFGFLLAAHLGLQTFAPVLSSAQLAQAIAPQVHASDIVVIHGEYESGSTLGFYLQRPATYAPTADAVNFIHILDGRSSNLWYGSFFTDAPEIFETPASITREWAGPRRIFLWQSLTDPPSQLPALSGPVYVLARSGGKEIVSNQPNR